MLFFCPSCKQNKPLSEFHSDRFKANGRSTYCALCGSAKAAKKRAEHPEREKATRKRFYARNREKLLAKRKAFYKANRKKEIVRARERYWKNPEQAKTRHRRIKIKALNIVDPEAKCRYCGERDPSKLELDHVFGDGKAHRSIKGNRNIYYAIVREGVPTDTKLQILCELHNGMKCQLTDEEFKNEVRKLAPIFEKQLTLLA